MTKQFVKGGPGTEGAMEGAKQHILLLRSHTFELAYYYQLTGNFEFSFNNSDSSSLSS